MIIVHGYNDDFIFVITIVFYGVRKAVRKCAYAALSWWICRYKSNFHF
jgi:uncharacterized membrane protein YkvA (DUF1232 family)